MKKSSKVDDLREALSQRARVKTLVALASGPCWAMATRLEAKRGAERVHVDLAGVTVVLPIERVLEVAE